MPKQMLCLLFLLVIGDALVAQEDSIIVMGVIRDNYKKKILPKATVILFERLIDETNDRYSNDSLVELQKTTTNAKGEYSFKIERNKDYKILANADGYMANQSKFNTKGLPEYEYLTLERNIDLPDDMGRPQPEIITKKSFIIFFSAGQTIISPENEYHLEKLVDLLKRNPTIALQVEGHTDQAEVADCVALGERRAKAALKYLYDKGIAPQRLYWQSFGDTQLDYPHGEFKALNSRVEFRIVSIDFGK